jgi:hypothetical protein
MSVPITRQGFIRGMIAAAGLTSASMSTGSPHPSHQTGKRPRAIAMWDFSWLERRWPGAGYEDWDQALDELVERGYDALRIDAYPHLIAADAKKTWLLKPAWDTQDWGAPTLVRVNILPDLYVFIGKCRDRGIKIGLSSWFREDQDDVRMKITSPERLAEVWNIALASIERQGLLDTILYVDLCNEWPNASSAPFVQPAIADGEWSDARSQSWMRTTIDDVRKEFPELPLLFSTNMDRVEMFNEQTSRNYDAIDHHLWMTGENDDEFYKQVGYSYERFSQTGYHNVQMKAAALFATKPDYWQKLLLDKIARLAAVSRAIDIPLVTTECWAIVDYKDWPLLPWDWVKNVCALGTMSAAATGRWTVIATSNFCGPQFRGMWRDAAWHRQLTTAIKQGPIDATLQSGRLWDKL